MNADERRQKTPSAAEEYSQSRNQKASTRSQGNTIL